MHDRIPHAHAVFCSYRWLNVVQGAVVRCAGDDGGNCPLPVSLRASVCSGGRAVVCSRLAFHSLGAGLCSQVDCWHAHDNHSTWLPCWSSRLLRSPAFLAILAAGLLTSFSSTLMFTSMGTFFNRISDPTMGGAYLTMLNTIMNVGMTLPQGIMFFLVDTLSYNICEYASICFYYSTSHSMCISVRLIVGQEPLKVLAVTTSSVLYTRDHSCVSPDEMSVLSRSTMVSSHLRYTYI
jgi:Acetyl-coenzyme A transporter 1